MRLLTATVLLVLAVGALSEKMLLGADDVDKKHAEMAAAETESSEPPKDIKEVKKQVKDDKRQLKELQDRARDLKEQLRDSKQLSKTEKKDLKRQFRITKHDLHAKKLQITNLKTEMKTLKSEKHHAPADVATPTITPPGKKGGKSKHRGGKRKNKNKHELIGAEETKINNPEQLGLQSDVVSDEVTMSKKEQRKLMKKMSRKADRKNNRKGKKHGNSDDEKTAEMPKLRSNELNILPKRTHSGKKHRGNRGNRIKCQTAADCHNGAVCFTNKKGHKFCKGNGMDKTAGKKCHHSEQCARGLKCFVTNSEMLSKRKHRKGICADPATADLTKGVFIAFKTSTK